MRYTPEEHAEHQALWVEALRSGKYRQAEGHLSVLDVGMCCMGVACDLAVKAGVKVERLVTMDPRIDAEIEVFDRRDDVCPPSVCDWLGLRNSTGELPGVGGDCDSLTIRNDRGATFDEIADLIEARSDWLFKTR